MPVQPVTRQTDEAARCSRLEVSLVVTDDASVPLLQLGFDVRELWQKRLDVKQLDDDVGDDVVVGSDD